MALSEKLRAFGSMIVQLAAITDEEGGLENDNSIWLVKYRDGSEPTFYMGKGMVDSDFFDGHLDFEEYLRLCDILIPQDEIEKAKENDYSSVEAREVYLDDDDKDPAVRIGLTDLISALTQVIFIDHPLNTK